MTIEQQPPDPLAGIDLAFIHRVYRTSGVLAVLSGLLIWERLRAPSALGWLLGSALSLLALAGVEWSVRRFVQPAAQSARSLAGTLLVKMLLIGVVMALAFAGALRGWISLPWVLAGFTLPHVVIVLKLIGQKLRHAGSPEERSRAQ
jgi:hypothetical protein